MTMQEVFVHPTAMVETDSIGRGTRVWAGAHILAGASVGADCNICDLVFIEGGASVGDDVTVKNGAMIFKGVTIEHGVFIGPGVVFTNDRLPRSPRSSAAADRYRDDSWLETTVVQVGASIGARAVITPGVTIAAHATVAAGAVVVADVASHALVVGVPARPAGWVCFCGLKLAHGAEVNKCDCGRGYRLTDQGPRFDNGDGAQA